MAGCQKSWLNLKALDFQQLGGISTWKSMDVLEICTGYHLVPIHEIFIFYRLLTECMPTITENLILSPEKFCPEVAAHLAVAVWSWLSDAGSAKKQGSLFLDETKGSLIIKSEENHGKTHSETPKVLKISHGWKYPGAGTGNSGRDFNPMFRCGCGKKTWGISHWDPQLERLWAIDIETNPHRGFASHVFWSISMGLLGMEHNWLVWTRRFDMKGQVVKSAWMQRLRMMIVYDSSILDSISFSSKKRKLMPFHADRSIQWCDHGPLHVWTMPNQTRTKASRRSQISKQQQSLTCPFLLVNQESTWEIARTEMGHCLQCSPQSAVCATCILIFV